MSKAKLTLVVAMGAVVLGISGMVMAGVPAGKEVITIQAMPVKQGVVTFAHAKHATEFKKADGSAISCKDCHHTMKTPDGAGGEVVQACTECHVKEGAPKTIDGKVAPAVATITAGKAEMKSVIFHKTCLDCHKAMKAAGKNIAVCGTCHKK